MKHCTGILLLIAALAGCAVLRGALDPPELALTRLEIVEAGPSEQRYRLVFRISNPNPVPLPVAAVRYRVILEGDEFAAGVTEQAFTVPAGGEAVFGVEARTDLVATLRRAGDWLRQGPLSLEYELRGEVRVTGLPRGLPFSRKGEIRLSR